MGVIELSRPAKTLRVMSISGGKGGIGKTTISVNLAMAFAKRGKKVLLFDADLGLANVDVILGLKPKKTIYDVLSGECSLEEVCIKGPHGLKIIPSSSGVQKMAELSALEYIELIKSFSLMADDLDVMLIDMASGISSQVIDFTHAAQDVLVVICNDPSSLMDSYAVIKILHQKYARGRFGIVVNKVHNDAEGYEVFSKFQQAITHFINISMHYIGHVPQDDWIGIAARERVSVVDKYAHAKATVAFKELTYSIDQWRDNDALSGGIHFFFEKLIQNR